MIEYVEMIDAFKLKNDRYRAARGGSARFLTLSCSACGAFVMIYQKDGPGSLLRCYVNRIFYPEVLRDLHRQRAITLPPLKCSGCEQVLGVSMKYKDGRLAYRLLPNVIRKAEGIHIMTDVH